MCGGPSNLIFAHLLMFLIYIFYIFKIYSYWEQHRCLKCDICEKDCLCWYFWAVAEFDKFNSLFRNRNSSFCNRFWLVLDMRDLIYLRIFNIASRLVLLTNSNKFVCICCELNLKHVCIMYGTLTYSYQTFQGFWHTPVLVTIQSNGIWLKDSFCIIVLKAFISIHEIYITYPSVSIIA